MKTKLAKITGLVLVLFAMSAISVLGQGKPAPERDVVVVSSPMMQGPEGPMPAPPPQGDFLFVATEMSFGGKLVKGAPYSAQAVTESTQTLSDGNRIVNKTTSVVYRDSEGRTRREQSFKGIGALATSGEPLQTIFIHDPVAGVTYTLDSRSHIARKIAPMRFKFEQKVPPPNGAKAELIPEEQTQFRFEIHTDGKKVITEDKRGIEAGVAAGWIGTRNGNAKTESLGKQFIEGVEAEGTRTTVTIPAGDIGNERPIEIVSERWYSPELQTIVMTRHSDPRFGENTYRLTNISRTEPARILFEVPSDYTIKEATPPEPMRLRKPMPPPEQQ
jgi:hypothetical protein